MRNRIDEVMLVGEISAHKPVLLIAAVTSRYEAALQWAIDTATAEWGELALVSPAYHFTETSFYTETMGTELKKQFLAFDRVFDPGEIAPTKHLSNDWEKKYAGEIDCPETRPLNIDPGYISEAKLVLVTTKDRDHRIYLQDGIFAEVTLYFRQQEWKDSRWTYPDYKREDFQEFFTQCRTYLRKRIRDAQQS